MSMEIITEEILIKCVADRWLGQYEDCLDQKQIRGSTPREIHEKLLDLDDTATSETVKEIIGNGSWTRVTECSNCGNEENKYLVAFGLNEICGDCVAEIIKISELGKDI